MKTSKFILSLASASLASALILSCADSPDSPSSGGKSGGICFDLESQGFACSEGLTEAQCKEASPDNEYQEGSCPDGWLKCPIEGGMLIEGSITAYFNPDIFSVCPDFDDGDDNPASSSSAGAGVELADCGGGYYNPETHFCVGNSFYEKCGGREYDIESQMCDTRDHKIYSLARIGTQTWMLENLNYSADYTLGYCYGADIFNAERNDLQSCDGGYGRLYRWAEVSPNTLCPGGWHIPTRAEWQTVISSVVTSSVSRPNPFYICSGNYNSNPEWPIGWGDRDINGFYWTSSGANYVAVMNITKFSATEVINSLVINSDASSADIFSVRCIKN